MPDAQWVCLALRVLLKNRVLGDMLKEGVIAKPADDHRCGGNTPTALLLNWKRALGALKLNNLCVSATKTRIAPKRPQSSDGYGAVANY